MQQLIDGARDWPAKWWVAYMRQELGGRVTDANYEHALFLMDRACGCHHAEDAAHDVSECWEEECTACGLVRCPKGEPLHFHHDGCPACLMNEWQ
jgi:hypothetical protein